MGQENTDMLTTVLPVQGNEESQGIGKEREEKNKTWHPYKNSSFYQIILISQFLP